MENIIDIWNTIDLQCTALLISDTELLNKLIEKTKTDENQVYIIRSFNYEQIKNEILAHNIKQVISEKQFIQMLNILQWECSSFNTYYILNCENPLLVDDENKNYLMNKKLWQYTVNNAKDQYAGGGWVNSYNRQPFSKVEMDEFSDNVYQKLKPYLNKHTKVLEIGCSSGLTMFKLLPYVGEYHAIDLSSAVLEKDKNIASEFGYNNVYFYNLPADQIDEINENEFDVVIMNSVIQCFHGYNYFRKVLKKCIEKMNTNGIIFLGDVMDLDLKDDLERSLQEYKNKHPEADTKLVAKGEIFYSRGFFEDCMGEFMSINEILFTNKIGTIKNELTKYRYDVILCHNKSRFNHHVKDKHQIGVELKFI